MNQPELGRKIAELRKAKGLTQEELISMCNLNVRTLQRIESGEVTPRSYTIKLIFAALDYNIYDASVQPDDTMDPTNEVSSTWPEHFFRYVVDLFNLKTNAMKKILILSAVTICMVFLFTNFSKAQASSFDKSKLVGTWQLCNPAGVAAVTGTTRYKIITAETFVVTEVDIDKKNYEGDFIGSYTFENDIYTETITYTTPPLNSYIGVTNSFKLELKDDMLYSKGINNSYNETWKRIKK